MPPLLDFLGTQSSAFRSARLQSLYSDFRSQKTTNPDGYSANVSTWENGLVAAAKAGLMPGGTLTLQYGPQLTNELQTREYGVPQALETVIEEAVNHGRFVAASQYMNSSRSIYDHSWDLSISGVPAKLASWVMRQTGLVSNYQKDAANRYVIVNNVEDAAGALANALAVRTKRVDRCVPIAEFRREAADTLGLDTLSDTDLEVLLTFLSRDRNLIAHNQDAVKVKSPGESKATLGPEDIQICSLKSLISGLNMQTTVISARIEEQHAKAKSAVARKNKAMAVAALRSKKLQEDLLAKRSETLVQLEGVYTKIEEAGDQVEIVNAMEGSTAVLRSLAKEIGGVERVEEVLDNLHDEMAKANEVGDLIGQQGSVMTGIDETAIDDELEQMEAAAVAAEERAGAEKTQTQLDALQVEAKKFDEEVAQDAEAKPKEKLVAAQ